MTKRTPSELGKFKRSKGVRWEREASKTFSTWLGCECRRTPMSGAYGPGWNLGGDLMFSESVPLYAELKNDESWRLEQLLIWKGPIPKWWEKAYEESCMWGKSPLLVLKRNHVDPIVVAQQRFLDKHTKSDICAYSYVQTGGKEVLRALLLEDFVRAIKPPIPVSLACDDKRIFNE